MIQPYLAMAPLLICALGLAWASEEFRFLIALFIVGALGASILRMFLWGIEQVIT